MAEIRVATDANFEELVLKSERPTVVDFWAAWCGPCKMVAPEMEKLAEKYDGRGRRRQGRCRRQSRLVAGVQHPEHPGDRVLQARLAAAGRGRVPSARAARADVQPGRVQGRQGGRGGDRRLTASRPFKARPRSRPGSFRFPGAGQASSGGSGADAPTRTRPPPGPRHGRRARPVRRSPSRRPCPTASRPACGRRPRRRPDRARTAADAPSAAATAKSATAARPGKRAVRPDRLRRPRKLGRRGLEELAQGHDRSAAARTAARSASCSS